MKKLQIVQTTPKIDEVTLPPEWGLNQAQAEQAFKRKAQSLLKNIYKTQTSSDPVKYPEYIHAFEKFFRSYKRSCNLPRYKKAKNGQALTIMWKFIHECAQKTEVEQSALTTLWKSIQ